MANPVVNAAIRRLIRAGYPESTARKIASGELSMDTASRMARAREQGFVNQQYHASMQDFQEIVPGYDDGLFFTTPNPEFANTWAGKGKMQTRKGEPDAYDRYAPQKRKIYEQLGSPEYGTPEFEEYAKLTDKIVRQEMDAFKTVYPMLARTDKTFDPAKDFDEIADLYDESRLNAPFSSDFPTFADALKSGAYILYENPEVVKHLKSKGYDSMLLRESVGSKADREAPYTTVANFYPDRNIRSQFAAFDPDQAGSPNILAGLGGAGVVGASLMAPEEAVASPLDRPEDAERRANARAVAVASDTLERLRRERGPSVSPLDDTGVYRFGAYLTENRPSEMDPVQRALQSLGMFQGIGEYLRTVGEGQRTTTMQDINAALDIVPL